MLYGNERDAYCKDIYLKFIDARKYYECMKSKLVADTFAHTITYKTLLHTKYTYNITTLGITYTKSIVDTYVDNGLCLVSNYHIFPYIPYVFGYLVIYFVLFYLSKMNFLD